MEHPDMRKKIQDSEYSRRYNRFFMLLLLQLIPLLVFAVFVWGEIGFLPWNAVGFAAMSCALVSIWLDQLVRRDTLAGMRRENLIGAQYKPPRW